MISRGDGGPFKEYRIASAVAFSLLFVGCLVGPADVADPLDRSESSDAMALNSSLRQADSTNVTCDIGVRLSGEQYRVRNVSILGPATVLSGSALSVDFIVGIWERGHPDPLRIALCEVPNSAIALQYVAAAIAGMTSSTQKAVNLWTGRGGRRNARDPKARRYLDVYAEGAGCPENGIVDFGCSCDGATCEGWNTMSLEGGGDVPPEELPSELLAYDYPSDPIRPPITCWMGTDYIHFSGQLLSVHGHSECTVPVYHQIQVDLQLEKCIFVCWWSTIGSSGAYSRGDFFAETHAKAPCTVGWWKGQTTHHITLPAGYTRTFINEKTYRLKKYDTCLVPI
jgi:hypothetical protein